MIGFIKYKLFKWLWKDVCKNICKQAGDCNGCPMGCVHGFGKCEECGNVAVDCYDVESLVFETARKAWEVE